MTRGDVETWRCGHCEKGAAGGGGIAKKVGEDRARLRWNLISLMGETFPPGEVISLELSHRVSDFWLIARRRCERHRHPWIQTRQEGCLFFFFSFFTRVERLKGGGGEKEESERGRDGSCPCFLIILKRSLERVSRLTFESRSSMEGVSANLFTVICSEGVEGYSLNGVVPRLGHSVMRAMISLFFDVRG